MQHALWHRQLPVREMLPHLDTDRVSIKTRLSQQFHCHSRDRSTVFDDVNLIDDIGNHE